MENNKISLGQSGGKSRLRELSTYETSEKTENAIPAATKKARNFGLKLFNGTSSRLCNNNNNNNKVYLKNFQNGLQVLAGVSFQNH